MKLKKKKKTVSGPVRLLRKVEYTSKESHSREREKMEPEKNNSLAVFKMLNIYLPCDPSHFLKRI